MNYSVVVWGFDSDNDYYHECDIIKAKNISEAFSYAYNVKWQGWDITKIEIEELKEKHYVVKYYDNYYHEIGNFSCKATSELDAKISFRMNNFYSDPKRYDIISAKGVKKCEE